MVEVHLGPDVKIGNKKSLRDGLIAMWKGITVEPLLVLYTLPFYMSSMAIQNLSLEKSCRVNLNLSTAICDAIYQRNHSGYTENDEVMVQKIVAAASVWKNVISSIFPVILLPLFGSWSDRNNVRTVLMILPIVGEIISNVGFMFCTFFFYELPMEVNTVIEVLPIAITGGFNMAFLGIFTFITSTTTPSNRTFRMGIIQTIYSMCVTIGTAISGVLYTLIGYNGVFSLSLIMYTMAGIYTYFAFNETVSDDKKLLTSKYALLKDLANVKDTILSFKFIKNPKRCLRSRQIYAVLVLQVLIMGPTVGQNAVMYLYTRLQFNWNEIDYSIFSGYYSIAHLIGNFGAIAIFSKWLQFDDSVIGMMSSVSKIAGGIAYTVATTALSFYLCTLLDGINGAAFVASRSMVTKLVTENDLGKINSLFGIVDSVAGLIYGPLYSAVYKVTIDTFPPTIYLVGVGLTVPALILYIWLYIRRDLRNSKEKDSTLENQ